MLFVTLPPPQSLAGHVRCFWVLEGEVSEKPYIHRSMADGCPELLFHYKGKFDRLSLQDTPENCFHSGIQGQSQQFKQFSAGSDFGMFGVYLYPYAIPELFHLDASAMSNEMPDLQTLFGQEAAGLQERMILATGSAERVAIISHFLESKLRHAKAGLPGIRHTIAQLIHSNEPVNVAELASRNFLSTRQFERHFKAMSGFSPKLFSRIARFQTALHENKDGKSLTAIAYDCGYYDQSHFIHDFKAFSGFHPLHYFSGKADKQLL